MKTDIINLFQNYSGELSKEEICAMIEVPPREEMGDYAIPCFSFAKKLHKSPMDIAKDLKEYLERTQSNNVISAVKNVGGYCNIFLNRTTEVKNIIKKASTPGFGVEKHGTGKTICMDYSSPNIAKNFHVGHLRTTIIGNSLYKIFEKLGYKVVRINHLGDWGTQFGKLIVAYKNWSSAQAVSEKGIEELFRIYVKFNEEKEKNSALMEQARTWFVKMEQNDEEAMKFWNWFKEISMVEFQHVYELLGISFDYNIGESFYRSQVPALAKKLEEIGLLVESEGAKVIKLDEYDMPPCMILKNDGGSIYHSRDIAAILYRKENFDFDQCIYVTGLEQTLHFKQVFKAIELMGYDWYQGLVHVPYGLVRLEGEKLSTRAGNIIYAEDILREAIKRAYDAILEKNPELKNKEETAKQVGVGAVIFHDLFNQRIKDVDFQWNEVLNFEGTTGPYVQYTYARACSILKKAELLPDMEKVDTTLLVDDISYKLIKVIDQYEEAINAAAENYEPSMIARYIIILATEFNRFYHECNILRASEDIKNARLVLVNIVARLTKEACSLLGMECPEEM